MGREEAFSAVNVMFLGRFQGCATRIGGQHFAKDLLEALDLECPEPEDEFVMKAESGGRFGDVRS